MEIEMMRNQRAKKQLLKGEGVEIAIEVFE